MQFIETQGLRLIPLNHLQLILLSRERSLLEKEMGLAISPFEVNAPESFMEEFSVDLSTYIIPLVENKETAPFKDSLLS